MKKILKQSVIIILLATFCFGLTLPSLAAMNDYCVVPPFVAQSAPPLVTFVSARDHKLYYQAYSDAADLDEDGKLDIDYKHSIDYYGYFDPYKCYSYNSTDSRFDPLYVTTTKFCNGSDGHWSGNVLNWVSMSRMDVLRKVLYGGNRSVDTTSATVLRRVYVPRDAHSWGKEMTGYLCNNGSTYKNTCYTASDCDSGYSCVNKSKALIGIDPSDVPSTCTATAVSSTARGMLVARYQHSSSKNCGTGNSQGLINSYEPANLFNPVASAQIDKPSPDGNPVPGTSNQLYYVSGFDDYTLNPSRDYAENYNILIVTTFTADTTGAWSFAVDGDDDVEVQVDGQVVAQYLGCHGPDNNQGHNGTINLTSGQTYTLVARHFEKGGGEGIKVWFKRPAEVAWSIFNDTNLYNSLTAPLIATGNECAIKTKDFVTSGIPSTGTVVSGGNTTQHLFCSTTLTVDGTPILRRLQKKSNRMWEWSAKEGPVCDNSLGTPDDFTVQVKVCDSSIGLESNCKDYSGTKKPTGMIQKYGEGDGTKICSKTFSKVCISNSDCGSNEGLCMYKAPMYFGLVSGSYRKNTGGGVLRKNISAVLGEEVNAADGTLISTPNTAGNIISTFNTMRIVDFNNSSYSCGWIADRAMNDGECRDWGNPIAEMMYETLRYLGGKTTATTEFTYTQADDAGLSLPKPDWGKYSTTGSTYKPYDLFPNCSKPFMLLLSDIYPSYDSDQIPGSSFSTFTEDVAAPQLGLGVQTAGKSLLNTLTDTIGTTEAISSNSWYIGESSSVYDNLCTSKAVTGLSLLRGLCPNEPTKRGTYYSAALAYYGRTEFKSKVSLTQDVNTYAVALSSPFSDMKVRVGGNYVTFLPLGKSVSGSHNIKTACHDRCTVTSDADGLHLTNCAANSFCPTNQIVNFFVDDIRYNASNDVIYARYRINYEDVEQGADHDMDAIVQYEICTQAAVTAHYGSCVTTLTASEMEIKLSSDYAAGSIDQVLGFIISGTTSDGPYLVVRDKDVPAGGDGGDTPAIIGNLPLTWSKVFTTTGTPTGVLKNPLWYAAKWGAFKDNNSNNKPDLVGEWDNDSNGDPDNYYLVVNPLKLEQQLDKALTDILASTSSGTAASIVNKRQESGANLLTAVFYPEREFKANASAPGIKVKWVGDLQNYWYYFDPFFSNSGLVEDTTPDNRMNLLTDRRVDLVFDDGSSQTTANLYSFDGKNYTLSQSNVNVNSLNALWRAGDTLFARTAARTIYTNLPPVSASSDNYAASFMSFADGSKATLQPYLQSPDATDAGKIIAYTHGTDAAGYRNRTITFNSVTNTWKLGDIVSSTPKIQSSIAINNYGNSYGDTTYSAFVKTAAYKNRNTVYVGANDGMLHAFSLGRITAKNKAFEKASIEADASYSLGSEQWAYIPSNALPYLRYLADPNYEHIFTVDLTSTLVDASIVGASTAASTVNSWKTLLIGGMGLGGASRAADGICASSTVAGGTYPDCIKAPINSAGYKNVGLSSYFALDVTTPDTPELKWEFSRSDLGLALLEPAIVRMGANKTNGDWFAVFVSGPTGPINTSSHQFYGRSDQGLKVFVVNLATGVLVKTFDVAVADAKIAVADDLKNAKAFGSSLFTNAIDLDEGKPNSSSYYSTDVVYIGYTRQKKNSSNVFSWDNGSDGGLLRLLTNNSADPANWTLTSLIDSVGPVTASIGKMYDDNDPGAKPNERPAPALWLYFGSGRYFYKDQNVDAANEQQYLFGLKEPCYKLATDKTRTEIDNTCALNLETNCSTQKCGLLKIYRDTTYNATTNPTSDVIANDSSNNLFDATFIEFLTNTEYENKYYNEQLLSASDVKKGWFAKLDWTAGAFMAERMITTPLVRTSGVTLFTTFKPTSDICSYGGKTLMNLRHYRTGGMPPKGSIKGTVIVQLSTGAIVKTDLSKISDNPVIGTKPPVIDLGMGKPPSQPPQDDKPRKPIKKILHIQEK